ncbi:MAG: Clp protease N-terminal domain-containing protein [Candidatus Paceibacterota bacterium]
MNKRIQDILALGRAGHETDRARDCIALGIKCADELGDNVFDSCHLLAGLYREGNGVAYHVLDNFDVTRSQIDAALATRERSSATDFRLDADIATVFDGVLAAASEMSHSYIGTEHLLIGATADTTKSAQLLTSFGLSPRDIENEVFYLLGHRLP